MPESDIFIDDVRLQDLGIIVRASSQEPALPDIRNHSIVVPNRHGAFDLGGWLEPREIVLNCVFNQRKNYAELKQAIQQLNELLIDGHGHPRAVKLRFGDAPYMYYNVRLISGVPIERIAKFGMFSLVFIAHDPYVYAPATYYDPDIVGNYADSIYGFEIVGKHDANNKPIENPTLLGQIGGRNYLPNSKAERQLTAYTLMLPLDEKNKHELAGEQVVVSFEARHDENSSPVTPHVYYRTSDGYNMGHSYGEYKETTTEYQRFVIPIDEDKIPSDMTNYDSLTIRKSDNYNTVYIRNVKLEKGNKATDWTPAPEDEGWPMKLVIEDKFYGDGTKNDRLIFEDGELYKEQWWEVINGVPILKDKPEKKLVKQKGGIYIAEGINTIHLTDDSGLLDSAIIRYQKGTISIVKGDNIVDIPKLDFNIYGVDIEYKNQVYSPFKNRRQYVGVYNYSQYETPFSFVIQGYCRNPKITNQTTGKSLKFNDLTLGANERLYVDSRRMTAWKIKIADDKYEFLTPHKIMSDYDAWDKINAHPNKSGDFLMLTAGGNSILFESDDTPDAEIYLDWEHRFL